MQRSGGVWSGVVAASLTIVLAEARTGDARSMARRAKAAAPAPAGEVYRSAVVMDAGSGEVLFE